MGKVLGSENSKYVSTNFALLVKKVTLHNKVSLVNYRMNNTSTAFTVLILKC